MNKFTNALVITLAAVSMPALADDVQPSSVNEKAGISKPGDVSPPVAQAMVDDRVLEDPSVDAVFALHAFPEWPAGSVALRAGSIMAGHSKFRIAVLPQCSPGRLR